MSKTILVAAIIAAFVGTAVAAPIFVRSSDKIHGAENDLFLDGDKFAQTLENSFLTKVGAPKNIFVFNVQIKDQKYIDNPRLLLKEIAKHRVLREQFSKPEFTIASNYLQQGFSEEFHNKLIQAASRHLYFPVHSDINNFDFKKTSNHMKSQGKVIDIIDLEMGQLALLDHTFRIHDKDFARVSSRNNLMVLKFTDATKESRSILNLVEKNEETLAPHHGRVLTQTDAATTFPISANGFMGYVIAILLLIVVYIGNQITSEIKTPRAFYDKPLYIGKEH